MRTIKTFVSGLLLSALLLLPASVRAAELQPFFTLKASSVNTLVGVAEKIGSMSGFADTDEFKEAIKTVKSVKGFDLNGIIGIAAAINSDGGISPILLLPITDLGKAEIPSNPEIFDSIRPFLVKRGDNYEINSPFATFIAIQKKDYLVITSEDVVDQIPADPKKLFADLEKHTLGVKLDLEKVDFETIEAQLFGPMLFMAMMSNPEAGEQLEAVIDLYRELFKEFAMFSGGIAFNPRTADIEFSGTAAPRKGSDMAKAFAAYKQQPTIFNGFRGTLGNTVFSFGDSAAMPPLSADNALLNVSSQFNQQQWETILEGLLEQVEMDDDTGEVTELAKKIVDSVQKIIETEQNRGSSDYAASFNTDGTLLLAFDTGSLKEIQNLVAMLVDIAEKKVAPIASAFNIDLKALVKQDYATIEGFKVSSFRVPMERVAPFIPDENAVKNLTPGAFWAVKNAGGKQAIAVAAGIDFAKAELAFTSALEKTKTSAPVQKPEGMISVQGLGKFMQQVVSPIIENSDMPNLEGAKKVFDILAASGNDATVTMTGDVKNGKMDVTFRISGKVIEALVVIGKAAAEGL